ncbi:MAG: hypothetical protein HZB91_02635 [Elusimicrobia bacterium]|nr:hypothetical protein [Elusimicrobiota bacterium]
MKGSCCEKLKRYLMSGVDLKSPFSCPRWRNPPRKFCACCADLVRTFNKTIKTVRLQSRQVKVPASVRQDLRQRLQACLKRRAGRPVPRPKAG